MSRALVFLSADDSHKNSELQSDLEVNLYFQGSPHSDFLYLKGRATISRDKDKIKELWTPLIKTWFTEGIDDPRITVIQVVPYEGYYWTTSTAMRWRRQDDDWGGARQDPR
jgi:general stress protein 26